MGLKYFWEKDSCSIANIAQQNQIKKPKVHKYKKVFISYLIYKLKFEKRALKEWDKLGHTLKQQLKNKLSERLENPNFKDVIISFYYIWGKIWLIKS